MNSYDIVIIGAGPGGYVASLYAAGFGKKVLVIEKDLVGGVCLNSGCIPTKALLSSVKTLKYIKESKEFGIDVTSYNVDYKCIKKRKDEIVTRLRKGIESLFKTKGIELKKGHARLLDKGAVEVDKQCLKAKDIIIATGSRPAELPNLKFDKINILSSGHILELDILPKRLLIIGGGSIGCEYAYIYKSLGVEVTIVEMMDRLLPTMDRELGKNMEMILKRLNVDVMTKTKLEEVPPGYDNVVVCVGRKYNTEGIGLEELGIKLDKGRVVVNENLKTNVPGIYATGDVIGGYLLAHVASHEGIIACDNIMGKDIKMDYRAIPICIYTEPEIASVGLTQEEAQNRGHSVKVSKFPFKALGKACAINASEGFLKLVGDEESGEVLGVHIVGPQASDLIAEATIFIKNRMKAKDICEVIHAHPTLPEAFLEAAYLFEGRPIHTI